MPKFSVIIPAYNVERYLQKCLDSILSQSFEDFEVVLIDDGSTDSTDDICDRYVALDKRIFVIHKQNEGVSVARNVGIDKARGEWCCFIDSDDWVESKYLENFEVSQRDDCQLIMQSFCIDDEIRNSSRKVVLPDCVFGNPSSVVDFLEKYPGVHNGFLWHRLFRLDIIKRNRIHFPAGISFAEDGWFFFDYMQNVWKTSCSSKIGNHYIVRNGSLTSRECDWSSETYKVLLEHYISSLLAFDVPDKFVESHIQMVKRYACRLASSWLIANAAQREECYEDFIGILKSINNRYDIYNVNGLTLYQIIAKKAIHSKSNELQKKLFKLSCFVKKYEDALFRRINFLKNKKTKVVYWSVL